MRRILVALGLVALATGNACAQRRGGVNVGFVRGGFTVHRTPYAPRYAGYRPAYGYGYLPYDEAPSYSTHAAPAVMLLQPSPEPPPVLALPPPQVHPVVTEYNHWGPVEAAANGQTQSFGIVMKDGSVRQASAVVAAGNDLLCVDPDDRHVRIAMNQVDRPGTLKLNRERGLNLHLPAAP